MRKFVLVLLLTILPWAMDAQNKFSFKRENVDDFPGKTTKVVLMGNGSFLDVYLKDAVSSSWKLSPYEFSNLKEFDRIKSDTSYYFLMKTDGQFKKESEPSLEFLTLYRGGSGEELASMDEILALPLQPVGDEDGRIFSYLPAYMQIIQHHIGKLMKNKLPLTVGISSYADDMLKDLGKKTVLFEEGDFSFPVTQQELDNTFKGKVRLAPREDLEEALDSQAPDTVVSLLVSAPEAEIGNVCYRLLIGCDDQKIYMFRKHKISKRNGRGFIKEDLKRIAVPFSR